MARLSESGVPIESIAVSAYTIPTDSPESDGTYEWDSTTLVLVRIDAGGRQGLGYTYADTATAKLIQDKLAKLLAAHDALAINRRWMDMVAAIRNLGRSGIGAMAISAIDTALWDLKAKLFDVPLATLLGMAHPSIAVYGSGGFTSYSTEQLQAQLRGWVEQGFTCVKMKVGRVPASDLDRITSAWNAIGKDVTLFVDANGAYRQEQALAFAELFSQWGVAWFEEPVSSDDLEGLRLLRQRRPGGMAIAAGEYGYDLFYFRRLLSAEAVDVLQADASRCGGVTGFMSVAALCDAFGIPLSSHCAPALHLPLCCAAQRAVHAEYFHDHARIERMLFDGISVPEKGRLMPDLSRPGLGIEFREKDAACYRL